MSGQKIIDGLKDAVAGNFSRITVEGQTWVRKGPPALRCDECDNGVEDDWVYCAFCARFIHRADS